MSFQQCAIDQDYNVGKANFAQQNITDGFTCTLSSADLATTLQGVVKGDKDRIYKFTLDFQNSDNTTCTCGYYLAAKNGGSVNRKRLCSHIIQGLISADNGAIIVPILPRQPRAARGTRSTANSVSGGSTNGGAVSQSFKDKISRAINHAVQRSVVLPVINAWEQGYIPFLIGMPGLGKSMGMPDTVLKIGFDGLESDDGKDSLTDADLVGFMKDQDTKVAGLFAKGFSRARNGEKIVIFMDEFARLNKRVQDIFLPAMTPVSAAAAKLRGVDTEEPVYIISAPLWGMEYAPVANIKFVLGANPWGAKFDNAFVDRVWPIKVNYDPEVLKHFDPPMRDAINQLWAYAKNGSICLPFSYRGVSKARNGKDTSIFQVYLDKLELLDQSSYGLALDCLVSRGLVAKPADQETSDEMTV